MLAAGLEAPGTPGMCNCGCEQKTRPAPRTDSAAGWVKGQPLRFVRNHHVRRPALQARPAPGVEGAVEIPLAGERGRGLVALVDDGDYEKVRGYRWHLSAAGVAFWAKQDSGPRSEIELPEDLRVRQMPEASGVDA